MEQVARQIEVEHPADQVWRSIAAPERLGRWLGGEIDVDLRVGGGGAFRGDDGTARRLLVEALDEGSRLVFRWWTPGDASSGSVVSIDVEPVGDARSRVRVREWRARDLEAVA